jgi:osmotically-inducible protein OsmY
MHFATRGFTTRRPDGGIDFKGERPDYVDFAYLALTIGMTFQVADTDLTAKRVRRQALRHALTSYVFGTVIVAITVLGRFPARPIADALTRRGDLTPKYGRSLRSFSAAARRSTSFESYPAEGLCMFKNSPLENDVITQLENDPRIADSAEIAVAGDGGIVTLRGTVERFSQRRAAEHNARGVEGVYEVINHLKVNLLGVDRREDDEIRGAALQNLIWDAELPSDSIDVKVQDSWVTLKGDVSFQFQSDAAYDDVSRLYGVVGVTNEIKVTNTVTT